MKNNFSVLFMLLVSISYSQIGINTNQPLGIFHVDAGNNNTLSPPTNTEQQDDFIINAEGKIGIGLISPITHIDVRSKNSSNSAIAIGYTNKTASEAGAGALRYNDISGGLLQVSDGEKWGNILSSPTKSYVSAHIVANNNTVKIGNTATTITNWSTIKDINNDFNSTTGIFTARRDGVYNVNFSYDLTQGSILPGSIVQAQFIKGESSILIKCLKTFGKANRQAQAGGNCNSTVELLSGETLKVQMLQNITTDERGLRSTTVINNPFYGFNNLSIIEL